MHQILIIGAGSIGERHGRCFSNTGRARVSIVETAQARREAVSSQYGWRAYESLSEALGDAAWSTVVICTPADAHVDLALQCLTQSLPVFIEKPLAVDTDGVDALVRETLRTRLPVGVAYVYRAHPALRAMRDTIVGGRFEAPVQMSVVSGQHFPTYRPDYASTYYARHESGGGAIQDALTHLVNACEWFIGPATRVSANAAHRVLDGVEVEDTVNVLARHGDVLASYSLNQHQAPTEATITVVCERGTARFELHRHAWRWMSEPDTSWQEETADFATRDDWFIQQEHAWLDAVEGKAAPLCSLGEGLQTLRMSRAALASAAAEGAWQSITQEVLA